MNTTQYSKKEILSHLLSWEAALLSEKYPQGKGSLRNRSAYCCLGVACDVSGLGDWNELEGTQEEHWYYQTKTRREREILPPEVLEYYNLKPNPPFNDSVEGIQAASHFNDTVGYTFPQIAALLRDTYITPLEIELEEEDE